MLNLPQNIRMNFYTGKVPQNMPIIQYIIEIAWNNQYYSCPQKLQAIGIFDNLWKWKEASMCKTFFPLISIKYLGEFQIMQILLPSLFRFKTIQVH